MPKPIIDETHDPKLESWIDSANDPDTEFPIQNLPVCPFLRENDVLEEELAAENLGVRIGGKILDVGVCAEWGMLRGLVEDDDEDDALQWDLRSGSIEALFAWTPEHRRALRQRLSKLLRSDVGHLRDSASLLRRALLDADEVIHIAPDTLDYTDFYASIHHATNVGSMFRPDNPLLPNYKHVPIGYHGRASSIVASGMPIRRPKGQLKADDETPPIYAPCRLLDYEMEVGVYVAQGNDLGEPIPIDRAEEFLFGLCLVNDWSARDIQKWEYQPLGPFLSKSFATSVSPYIVTMEALAPFRCPAFERDASDPKPIDYLRGEDDQRYGGVDLTVEVHLLSQQMRDKGMAPVRLSQGSFKDMYWTIAQMLTHHASNGCNMRPGDLFASGTVSGPEKHNRGCMLELTWRGSEPIELPSGETRKFLQDGDEIILRGFCERDGYRRIGFGECRGVILPAEG